jgi:hypothetical protein
LVTCTNFATFLINTLIDIATLLIKKHLHFHFIRIKALLFCKSRFSIIANFNECIFNDLLIICKRENTFGIDFATNDNVFTCNKNFTRYA